MNTGWPEIKPTELFDRWENNNGKSIEFHSRQEFKRHTWSTTSTTYLAPKDLAVPTHSSVLTFFGANVFGSTIVLQLPKRLISQRINQL